MQSQFLAVYDETDATGTVCAGGEFLYRPRLGNEIGLKNLGFYAFLKDLKYLF